MPGGLKAKDLIGMPWRLAFALQDDGWYLRSAPVWVKPNPMPESVRDRPTSAYEMVFMLTKNPIYYYDQEGYRMPSKSPGRVVKYDGSQKNTGHERRTYPGAQGQRDILVGDTANLRNVWEINTQPRPEAHFATFPDELPRRCILLSTSEHGVCAKCGKPWERLVERGAQPHDGSTSTPYDHKSNGGRLQLRRQALRERGWGDDYNTPVRDLGWEPSCSCGAGVEPGMVLGPFVGSGTTVSVAQSLGRRGLGLDLNPEYLDIAVRRLEAVPLPLLPA